MVPLSFEQLDKNAACLSTAVHIASTGDIPKESGLFMRLQRETDQYFSPGSRSHWCGRLLTRAFGVEEDDFGALIPLLSVCDGEAPPAIPVTGAFPPKKAVRHERNLDMALDEGALQDYFCRRSEVEEWVAAQARHFLCEMRQCLGTSLPDARKVSDILLGVSAAAHDLMAGLSEICGGSGREVSFTAHCISEIRNAVVYTVFRRLLSEGAGQCEGDNWAAIAQGARKDIGEFCSTRFRPERMSARSAAEFIRRYLNYLLRAQDEFLLYLGNEKNTKNLPLLASLLTRHCGEAGGDEPDSQRILPWGQCTLLERSSDGRVVIYSADGILHSSMLAVTDPERGIDTGIEYALPGEEDDVPAPAVMAMSCRMDETGKIYFSDTDRFAPESEVAGNEETRAAIRNADAVLNKRLVSFWERYPELFGKLSEHGPLLCLRDTPQRMIVFLKSSSAVHLAPQLHCPILSPEETARVAEECSLWLPPKWSSFAMTLEPEEDNGQGTEQVPDASDVSDRAWRRRVRQKTGLRKIPSLEWIVEHLRPFGKVELSTQGKGSHGSVLLVQPSGTHQQTICRSIEGTQSVTWGLLWEFLERLKIPYEQFYESL